MEPIQSTEYKIYFNDDSYRNLQLYIDSNQITSVFILVDTNTKKYCLPRFLEVLSPKITTSIVEIQAGEVNKNIQTCVDVWNKLTYLNADRKSLMINLGGGMVTDLGGFVASTYKRGIRFVNIPTTLLSMVDASVGSKTGVDLGSLKNLIGLFSNPEMVLIDIDFLKTVSDREIRSGLAEVIKYGLSYDTHLWEIINKSDTIDKIDLNAIIQQSIQIKNKIVVADLKEASLRKILNFGHTIGHAVESYFLESSHLDNLTHGEAIAIGMVTETYLSYKVFNFPLEELKAIKNKIIAIYGKVLINTNDYKAIIDLMKHDKKNVGDTINFVLLKQLGLCQVDCKVSNDFIIEALNFYNN